MSEQLNFVEDIARLLVKYDLHLTVDQIYEYSHDIYLLGYQDGKSG